MVQLRNDKLPLLISVVGCDGSGKSTLSADLIAWMNQNHRTESVYLGLRSGEIGNKIKALPIIGPRFENYLAKKAAQAKKTDATIPGLLTAIVIFILSLFRRRRFNLMQAKRKEGVIIITDRYPQTDVPGFYDGPGLSAARAEGWLIAYLARKEMEIYRKMAATIPDLVIRLNIDVETAYARKPDHRIELLQAKVTATPLLTFNGAHIVDLSSLDPYEEMLDQAKQAVTAILSKRN